MTTHPHLQPLTKTTPAATPNHTTCHTNVPPHTHTHAYFRTHPHSHPILSHTPQDGCLVVHGAGEFERIFFRVLNEAPSRAKLIHISAGAGRTRAGPGTIAVALCDTFVADSAMDLPCVSCSYSEDNVRLLDLMKVDMESLAGMKEWDRGPPLWYFRAFMQDAQIQAAVQQLVAQKAYPPEGQAFCNAELRSALLRLQECGLAVATTEGDDDHWRLTQRGMLTMEHGCQLKLRRGVTDICGNTPLADQPDFALMSLLAAAGWQWRRKLAKGVPLAYVARGAKLWYSGGLTRKCIPREYLLVLLTFDDLCARYLLLHQIVMSAG